MGDMPDILVRICRAKQDEIGKLKCADRSQLERLADEQSPPRDFRNALVSTDAVALIAEVKKASPSAGVIRPDLDPVAIARAYEAGGAACISVLTDAQFFQGRSAYLTRIRNTVGVPVLRKDFILDELQVVEARALGADACLLIAAALDVERLGELTAACRRLGMAALVEAHDERELKLAAGCGADVIGINNRDLRTFKVDLAVCERLAPLAPREAVLVAESGIRSRADVERLKECGIDAVLVGETLMRAADIEAAARSLTGV